MGFIAKFGKAANKVLETGQEAVVRSFLKFVAFQSSKFNRKCGGIRSGGWGWFAREFSGLHPLGEHSISWGQVRAENPFE